MADTEKIKIDVNQLLRTGIIRETTLDENLRGIESFRIDSETKHLFPGIAWKQFKGAVVDFSHPTHEKPILKWYSKKRGGRCVAFPVSSGTTAPEKVREHLEFYRKLRPDETFAPGPSFHVFEKWEDEQKIRCVEPCSGIVTIWSVNVYRDRKPKRN